MKSFSNRGQTQGDALKGEEARGELVGWNEKREGWHKRAGTEVCLDGVAREVVYKKEKKG